MSKIENEKTELIRSLIHEEVVRRIIEQEWEYIKHQKLILIKDDNASSNTTPNASSNTTPNASSNTTPNVSSNTSSNTLPDMTFEKGMITGYEMLLERLEKKFGINKENVMK